MTEIDKLVALDKAVRAYGFAWPDVAMVIDKVQSELNEVKEVIGNNEGQLRLKEEIGDLLHTVISLCVFLNFEPNEIIKQAGEKFSKRFAALQNITKKQGHENLLNNSIEQMLEFWQQAKIDAENLEDVS